MAPSVNNGPISRICRSVLAWVRSGNQWNRNGKLVDPPGSIASDFVVLVLSEAVLSETVLVLDGCWNGGDADR